MKYGDITDDHEIRGQDLAWVSGFLRHHRTGTDNLGRVALGRIIQTVPITSCPTVLDVACGTAVNWETWKSIGVQCAYTGLDSTQALLDEAKRRYGNDITLAKGFAQELPFQDGEFDVVVVRHLLEHVQEGYETIITEALRVARTEAVVVFFIDPHEGSEDIIEERASGLAGHPEITHHWNTYSWPQFTQFIAGLGVQMKVGRVVTPGAAHADTIVRLIK